MICPRCGYDMETKHRCLRCGYEIKTLVAVDEEEQKRRERETAKVIDPRNTYLTDADGYSVDDDDDVYADPFGSLLGSIFGFDPFADLFGGLFGMGSMGGRRRREAVYMDRVREPGEDDGTPKVVDINSVEVIDNDGKDKNNDGKDDKK